jgi:pimeloyl-ACP methyl ester carboxylesterase
MSAKSQMARKVAGVAAVCAGLLALGIFATAYTTYPHVIKGARKRVSVGSAIAQTPCGPIEYAVAGDGPPVLFVHGAGGGYDQGLEFSRPLVHSGFRIIAVSRFGYLRAPLPRDASATAQADTYACLLDALGIPRAAVIGGSAGAPSSVQFALRHPGRVTALVLVVPALYVPRPGGAPPVQTPAGTGFLFDSVLRSDFLFWAATRLARDTMTRAILATPPEIVKEASVDERARVAGVLEHILPVSSRRLGLLNDAAVISKLGRYELERIATPTLIISVADDLFGTIDPARYAADHIHGARLVAYPTGGHLWVGHQHELMSEIEAFLRLGKDQA